MPHVQEAKHAASDGNHYGTGNVKPDSGVAEVAKAYDPGGVCEAENRGHLYRPDKTLLRLLLAEYLATNPPPDKDASQTGQTEDGRGVHHHPAWLLPPQCDGGRNGSGDHNEVHQRNLTRKCCDLVRQKLPRPDYSVKRICENTIHFFQSTLR